jgi:hypothetical protein
MINKQDMFSEIVLMNIKGWPASQEKFLLAWKDQVRRYKVLNGGHDINDVQKLSLLQVAVRDTPSLTGVKYDADILSTQLGKSLTFNDYYNLLKSLAQPIDSATTCTAGGTKKIHRQTLCS